jgi:hypothetical protein
MPLWQSAVSAAVGEMQQYTVDADSDGEGEGDGDADGDGEGHGDH